MRTLLACCALALFPSFASAADQEWIQLFNGRDLTGWTPKLTHHELGDNFGDTFRVEDGLLKVRYDRYPDGFQTQFGSMPSPIRTTGCASSIVSSASRRQADRALGRRATAASCSIRKRRGQ
jgi:hypothetical protein